MTKLASPWIVCVTTPMPSVLVAASLPVLFLNTERSFSITSLPEIITVVLPFVVLMNDTLYVKEHTSGRIGNVFLAAATVLAGLLALVVVPLEILGG